jgi:hypothetical protein
VKVRWLQFVSLVFPNKINFRLTKLFLNQESSDPSKQLSFIRVIEVIIIIIGIQILFYTFLNIFDISDSSYFASCFVEKYLSYVLGHLLPVYCIESIAKTGKDIGVFLLPYFAQCECCPEHLSVV